MPLRYVLDEHLRGLLWRAIQRQSMRDGFPIDIVRVGDPPNLPLGTSDSDLLLWAEREDRILVSADKNTMVAHLKQHLARGHHSPGVFMLLPRVELARSLSFLIVAAYASEPEEWQDRIEYIG